MTAGYLLLLALGAFWTLVAITLSEAKSKNCSIFIFYFIGSLLAVILLFLIGGIQVIREITMPEKRFALLCFAVCSVLNGTGQGITMWNLKKGGRALAYAIPQLAFLLPFIWSIFFWNQVLNWRSGGGILLIVGATIYLSIRKHAGNDSNLELKRVLISTGAMLICGFSQILMITPTQLPPEKALSPQTGACVIQGSQRALLSDPDRREQNRGPLRLEKFRRLRCFLGIVCNGRILRPSACIADPRKDRTIRHRIRRGMRDDDRIIHALHSHPLS